jgi:nicotinamide-nucleotide amidase
LEAKIITIGDELLIGQVVDTNSAWLGAALEKINIKVTEIRSISDKHNTIINNLHEMIASTDVLIITGGLGPTNDDVTKNALVEYFGSTLAFHEETYRRLEKLFARFKIPIRESHRMQAYLPNNCQVLINEMGTAQGMWFEKDNKIVISTPGVPYEMHYIMEHSALPMLEKRNPDHKIYHRTIMTVGWGETKIEEAINEIIEDIPEHIKIAYLPGLGKVRVRLSSASNNGEIAEVMSVSESICKKLGDIVYGFDDEQLEAALGNLLLEKDLSVGTAESCTGGFLAHKITSIPGSSRYFKGSVIAYDNSIKQEQLKVSPETLEQYGAVSEQVVIQMVQGLINNYKVDVAISTSGIAGPDGGTAEKPVGTIWIACGNEQNIKTRKLQLTKNRLKNIEYTTIAAMDLLRKFLIQ